MNAKTPDALLQEASLNAGADWKDAKRYLWLLSPAIPLIGLGALTAYAVAPKKLRALAWTGPALVHGVIPALDRLIGDDTTNPPEAAILAIGGIIEKPVVKNGQIVIGHTMKVTISADHRVTDGAEAAEFMVKFKAILENPMRMLA